MPGPCYCVQTPGGLLATIEKSLVSPEEGPLRTVKAAFEWIGTRKDYSKLIARSSAIFSWHVINDP